MNVPLPMEAWQDDWVGISPSYLQERKWQPLTVVRLSSPASLGGLVILGRLWPTTVLSRHQADDDKNNIAVCIHRDLYEYWTITSASKTSAQEEENDAPIRIYPHCPPVLVGPATQDDDPPLYVTLERMEDIWDCAKENTGVVVTLEVRVLYTEMTMPSGIWTTLLVDRHVQAGTALLLHHNNNDDDEISLLSIDVVQITDQQGNSATTSRVVRLPVHPKFLHVHEVVAATEPDERTNPSEPEQSIINSNSYIDEDDDNASMDDSIVYAELAQRLRQYLFLQGPARPHGILLQGVAGIGKSHLVRRILKNTTGRVHWIAAANTIMDIASLESFKKKVLVLQKGRNKYNSQFYDQQLIVVLDDVHLLLDHDDEGNDNPHTWKQYAAFRQFLNDCKTRSDIAVLAMGRPTIATSLTSSQRLFEVVWTMETPTAQQRELLWRQLLQPDVPESYATVLASVTAGCVASDLCHIYRLAETRAQTRSPPSSLPLWTDLQYAVQSTVPSQLALLDVVVPPSPALSVDTPQTTNHDDSRTIHSACWRQRLRGYTAIEQRLYRTVVLPWRRRYSLFVSTTTKPSDHTLSVPPPSGILLHGPPGCGKTQAASCIAASLGLPMIRVKAANVLDKWLGGSEATLRALFARARSAAPCVLLLDEIDALATNRATSDSESSGDVMSRILSTLLNEMDGISNDPTSTAQVLVIACTNRLEALDAALLRPGRLDEHVELNKLEKENDVHDVLQFYLARAPLEPQLDLHHVAQQLVTLAPQSGADVEGLCRMAILRAMRRADAADDIDSVCITSSDLLSLLQ